MGDISGKFLKFVVFNMSLKFFNVDDFKIIIAFWNEIYRLPANAGAAAKLGQYYFFC
ncbi:hypothetical protein [Autumnicola psychrophila]|uniref:Uncharacterized protein n=1 Tax=Autumnicola psychrophila TaxID=3075592 RepID=A0ABU3DQK9_9FLAO|nr:hypothetical protein [Zunongwangia sp. F225]MDT0685996.1 hypothetical protein [Zunongwangia sp. F225]